MSDNRMRELQARHVAGERLSETEATWLLQRLDEHPDEWDDFLADETIDNQLRGLARVNDPEAVDSFVQDTVQAFSALEPDRDAVNTQLFDVVHKEEGGRGRHLSLVLSVAIVILFTIGVSIYVVNPSGQASAELDFARVAHVADAKWEVFRKDGREWLRFREGNAELRFDKGTVVQLSGPTVVELTSPDELFIEGGSVQIHVPPAAVGFTVLTPMARIVDLGTVFDVVVRETGETETEVRTGHVTFTPRGDGIEKGKTIHLTAEGLNRAVAELSDATLENSPIATSASGGNGEFFGAIYSAGKTVEFRSRSKFERFTKEVETRFKVNPNGFREDWKVIIESSANSTGTSMESRQQSGGLGSSSSLDAREMLLDQLNSMKERHKDNPQMQELIEGMIRQAEEGNAEEN